MHLKHGIMAKTHHVNVDPDIAAKLLTGSFKKKKKQKKRKKKRYSVEVKKKKKAGHNHMVMC